MKVEDALVGAWELVAVESQDEKGDPFLFQDDGRMHFSRSGHFAAMSTRSNRPRFRSPSPASATEDELRQAMSGFVASFGTFAVEESAGVLVLKVRGALVPNLEGSEQRRLYELSGRRLRLRTVPGTFPAPEAYAILTWERLD